MTTTDRFYNLALHFQNARINLKDERKTKTDSLKRYEGSDYYKRELKKVETEYREKLEELQKATQENLYRYMEAMSEANKKRGVVAPTEEQLRVLQVLRMRDSLTREDVEQAVNSMGKNDSCLSALRDIAHKNGIVGIDYGGDKYSRSNVDSILKSMRGSVNDFLKYETAKAARMAARYHQDHYGETSGGLPARKTFSTKAECFHEFCGVDGNLESFYKAIDGDGE